MVEKVIHKFKDKARGGQSIRIYAVDGGGVYPIHGAWLDLRGVWLSRIWTVDGFWEKGALSPYDLIPLEYTGPTRRKHVT